jgi:hypothetical protein
MHARGGMAAGILAATVWGGGWGYRRAYWGGRGWGSGGWGYARPYYRRVGYWGYTATAIGRAPSGQDGAGRRHG